MEPKTRPSVPKLLSRLSRGADHFPIEPVDEADFLNVGGPIRLADLDGSFDGALSWVNVKRLQPVSRCAVTSRYENFARLSEPERLGNAVSMLENSEYELVREVQERGVCLVLRFRADATLVSMENHGGTVEGVPNSGWDACVCCSGNRWVFLERDIVVDFWRWKKKNKPPFRKRVCCC
jgi:hypothetical protein